MDDEKLGRLVEAMFQHNQRGRLVGASPLLHVVRTPDGAICRCHANMPDSTAAHLTALAASPRGRPGKWAEEYARYLSLAADVSALTAVRAGPLFCFPESLTNYPDCITIGRGNSGLLGGALDEWVEDAENGALMVAAMVDGRAVSVCATVKSSETVHCAGVETAPSYRGRGLAERVVMGWAKLVRANGAEPYYATTFDNIASQKVAARLGLTLIGSEFSVYGTLAS
ncbi:GNAT family N-acetyltransferase [Phenylobacterium sp.]|uniref:GNAT family N-acetyltransferase n=1 Tax=Phenylobacterium sp. TaxID=1871053 RepID=UPI00271EDF16|nr:GNAT family N-acetyltransferase [Phenylobacterium sp.]MDO8799954.1 GNAT family N-acetyltransferase [Phenylobacterium sp.]